MGILAENIKIVRKDKKLSQEEFANKFGLKQRVLSYYEKSVNDIPSDLITKIIEEFNLNAQWFLTGKGEMYQLNELKKTNTEVPAIPGISADEREAIRIIRENPELFKLNQAYAKHKKKGKDAIESFVDGLQINLSLQNSV